MSPSEFDLRAALHDGEGDPLDADAVVAAGRARVARRRAHLRAGASAAVLVALVGGGVAVLAGTNPGSPSAGGGGRDASATEKQAAGAGKAASPRPASSASRLPLGAQVPQSAAAKATASCPSFLPPAAPGPSAVTPNPSRPLFAKPVATMLVCAYPTSRTAARPVGIELSGAAAQQVAASLDHASTTPVPGACPNYVRADQRQLAFIARTADGTALPTVTTIVNAPTCRVVVVGDHTVRYGWSPPAVLRALLGPTTPTPAPKQGSPARS